MPPPFAKEAVLALWFSLYPAIMRGKPHAFNGPGWGETVFGFRVCGLKTIGLPSVPRAGRRLVVLEALSQRRGLAG